jgi:hypothetical protein
LGITYSLLSVKYLHQAYESVTSAPPGDLYAEAIPIEFWAFQAAKTYCEASQQFDLSNDLSLKRDVRSIIQTLKQMIQDIKYWQEIEKGTPTYAPKGKCRRCKRSVLVVCYLTF